MKLMKMVKRFVKDERGLEASEYALLLALIAVALVGVIFALRGAIANVFDQATGVINGDITVAPT